jgi:hypothetical protein
MQAALDPLPARLLLLLLWLRQRLLLGVQPLAFPGWCMLDPCDDDLIIVITFTAAA